VQLAHGAYGRGIRRRIGHDAHDILESLRDRGVVQADAMLRYTLTGALETELKMSLDVTRWVERALRYFIEWAEQQGPDTERLLSDLHVILQLLEWAAEAGRWADVLRLGRAVEGALALGRRWGAWAQVLGWMLRAARALGDPLLKPGSCTRVAPVPCAWVMSQPLTANWLRHFD